METQNIEYKLQWRDEFLKEICGFANGQGGILYIGVNDNGEVVGVDKINELLSALLRLARHMGAQHQNGN